MNISTKRERGGKPLFFLHKNPKKSQKAQKYKKKLAMRVKIGYKKRVNNKNNTRKCFSPNFQN